MQAQTTIAGPRRPMLARLWSVIRGDKYLADAYPPEASGRAVPAAPHTKARWLMRDRHIPRLCGSCHAPMARQEDACWRCATRWASEDQPRTALHAVPEDACLQTERWIDEGGSFDREAMQPAAAGVARG